MTHKSSLVIGLAVAGLAGVTLTRTCLANGGLGDGQYMLTSCEGSQRGDMESKRTPIQLDARGAKRLKLDLQYAEVDIDTTSGSEMKGEIVKEINKPIDSEERQWLNNDWLRVRRDGDTLVVYEVADQKPKLDSKGNKKNHNIKVHVTLHVPKDLEANLELMAGTVKLEGQYRSLKSHLNAGEFTTDRFTSDQFVDLHLDAGQVNAKLGNAPSQDSQIKVNVGEINLDVKGNATVEAAVGIGDIEVGGESNDREKGMGSKSQIRVGSGGTKFRLNVDAGSITVKGGKTEKRSVEKMEFGSLDKDIDIDLGDEDIAEAQKDAKDALKDIHIDFKGELGPEIQKEVEKALKEAQKEIDKAMKEVDKEMEKARIEMKSVETDKDSVSWARTIAKDAMKAAQKAMEMARLEMKKALKNRKDHESI